MANSVPNFFGNDSDDEEDDENADFKYSGRDGMIFLIDCSLSMFEPPDADPAVSYFQTILECIEQSMKNLIITNDRTLVSIVFYNTKNSPKPKMETDLEAGLVVPDKTAIFMPMTQSSAETIKYIKNIKESSDFFDFPNRYGHTDDCNFADALWLCSRLKSCCGYKLTSCKLYLFTDKNTPHVPGTHEFQQCFVRAKDLNQLNVLVLLIPLAQNFERNVFYKEFLCTALNCDADDVEICDPTTNIDRLKKQIFRQDYRKRVNYHLTWTIGDGLDVGVGVYGLTRKKIYIKKLKLQRDTNEEITSKRSNWVTTFSEDNQEEIESRRLMPGEEKKCIFLGGEQITLTVEEHTNMKQMTNPGCKLLGFKPASVVSVHYHSKGPHFLFADETLIKGSSKLFSGLWQACLAKEKVAICLLTLRRRTWPRFVALVPQAEIRSAENDLIRPNGFRVEYLPFAEDIRNLSFLFQMPVPSITDDQKELMKKITKKLRFNYSPSIFENPVLITCYANIEAIVFETDRKEIEDTTRPDVEYQDSKLNQFMDEITKKFGENVKVTAPSKRVGTEGDSESQPAEKRPKSAPAKAGSVLEVVRNGKGNSLTVAVLKEYLKTRACTGLSKMTKPMLIEKVHEMDR